MRPSNYAYRGPWIVLDTSQRTTKYPVLAALRDDSESEGD